MKEKNVNKIKTIEYKHNLIKNQVINTGSQNIKSVKNGFQRENSKINLNNSFKTKKKKNTLKNNEKVLKRKITEDGAIIEKVFSVGEDSSGFETVSSVNSEDDNQNFELDTSIGAVDYNVIMKMENKLSFQSPKERIGGAYYWKNRLNSRDSHKDRARSFLNDHKNRYNENFKNLRKQKFGQNNLYVDMYCKYDKRDKKSNERKDCSRSRRDTSGDRDWGDIGTGCRRKMRGRRGRSRSRSRSRSKSRSRSRSRSRNESRPGKSRHSRTSELINRSRSSKSPKRNIMLKNPDYKDRKTEARCSGNFDMNSANSHPKRNSPSRKRRLHSASPSVWTRLRDEFSPFSKVNKKEDSHERTLRDFQSNPCRNKEIMPILMKSERKSEDESLRNFTKETANSLAVAVPKILEISQNSSLLPLRRMPATNAQEIIHPFPCAAMPALSVDNLPLLPGPMGLPVHITATGEQIPHDMDGRRIPIGPNGCYLPVDPTGRLFPHIIFPGNQAIPIHMTEDGVLRLPNSEPVPNGPGHQLPVNIDGSVIQIGPDSKPLYLCSNLPRESPLSSFKNSFGAGQLILQKAIPFVSQTSQTENQQILATEARQTQNKPQISIQSSKTDSSLLELAQNSFHKMNKVDLLENYKKKARERNEYSLRFVEKEKNLGVNPSEERVKRLTYTKLSRKKSFTNDTCNSGFYMVSDSNISDSSSVLKSTLESHKDATAEIILISDVEQEILKIVCDSNNHETQNAEPEQNDPIVKKIQRVIKSLCEKNYKPPAFGRFLINSFKVDPVIKNSPNESPLIRNRIKLPFLVPSAKNIHPKNQPTTIEKTAITFHFLSQENAFLKEDFNSNMTIGKNFNARKCPLFTSDFAIQCDFTSAIIKNLSLKVSKLEKEVTHLRNINANILDNYKKIQDV